MLWKWTQIIYGSINQMILATLIVQTGFLAKDQLPSICPDPIVILNLARTCKREYLDRLLRPINVLKFYLYMTSSNSQNRTRLFLPIKGNYDIS